MILPSVALAEYLTPIDLVHHKEVIAALTKRFIVPPFDVRCASLAASLFAQGKDLRLRGKGDVRKTLRADSLIIATAVVHGARTLYTGDGDCRKLAAKVPRLEVKDLPDIPPDLFAFSGDNA